VSSKKYNIDKYLEQIAAFDKIFGQSTAFEPNFTPFDNYVAPWRTSARKKERRGLARHLENKKGGKFLPMSICPRVTFRIREKFKSLRVIFLEACCGVIHLFGSKKEIPGHADIKRPCVMPI
jgi:hypothetical protein